MKVKGYYGDFTYVEYVLDDEEHKGYIFSLFLNDDKEGSLQVKDFEHIYEGASKEIKFNYSGAKTIKWSVSQSDSYIECKKIDGGIRIKGLKPGTAKITVTAGSETEELDVHCVYKWKRNWVGETSTATEIRTGPGEEYEIRSQLFSGDKFYVHGDDGGSTGWAYGYGIVDGTNYWGFVDISKISNKNTVSFYNSLGWRWPLQNTNIKYITSTYGPRNVSTGSSNHRGIDVTTGVAGEIAGEPLVAPFDGTVKKVGYDSSCGYFICITSKQTDPTTGYKIIAIYMHMNSSALFDSQREVSKGTVVGYVGTTGDSSGYHLHMEANNKNAGIGDSNRTTYKYTINPLYFYMNVTPKFSDNNSYKAHGGYWYNEDA